MNRMMIDIETCGLSLGTAVLTLGLCIFNKSEIISTVRYRLAFDNGSLDPKTVQWWMDQFPEAREDAWSFEDRIPTRDALTAMAREYRVNNCKEVWSHGASFDIPKVERLIAIHGHEDQATLEQLSNFEPPWHYRAVRDTRTLFAVWAQRTHADGYDYTPLGTPDLNAGLTHTAGYDARYQATQVQEALNALGMD